MVVSESTTGRKLRVRVIKGDTTLVAKPVPGTGGQVNKNGQQKTGDAVADVSRAVGEHLGKVGGMFAAFKEEYDKASK